MAERRRSVPSSAGQRVKRKVIVALALTTFVPLLVVTYCLYAYTWPFLTPERQAQDLPWMLLLLAFTGVMMTAGSFLLWDLAKSVARTAEALPREPAGGGRLQPRARSGETVRPAERRSGCPHALLLADAQHHRAASRRCQPVLETAGRSLQGTRIDQRPSEGVLVQGRGHGPVQPALFLDPARGRSVPLSPLQPPRVGGPLGPGWFQGRQRRPRPRGGGRNAARHGRHPAQAVARDQRDLPVWRRRVRRPAGGDVEERREAVRGPHPIHPVQLDVQPREARDGQLRHRLAAGRRHPFDRGADPGRRRSALRGQAGG